MRKLRATKKQTTYKNPAFQAFADACDAAGWDRSTRGCTSFICYKGNEIIFVEVKRGPKYREKKDVHRFKETLKKYGIKTYKWWPGSAWNPS